MANLAIKGHKTRGKEVIEILEMLGGKSYTVLAYKGEDPNRFYCINKENNFIDSLLVPKEVQVFSLEEFLEKFPYKVGDKVIAYAEGCLAQFTIQNIRWNYELNKVEYKICSSWCDTSLMIPYKEETMDKANKAVFDANAQCCDIMNHLIKEETMGNKPNLLQQLIEYFDNTPRDVLEKEWNELSYLNEIGPTVDEYLELVKKYRQSNQYPKTYEECCEVLGCKADDFFTDFSYDGCDVEISDYEYKIDDLLQNFRRLRYCRDAYWKIAGEQMGLGKPWEPDFTNDKPKYCLYVAEKAIEYDIVLGINTILTFPTAEMRDAFYENFKDLIEQCKELL